MYKLTDTFVLILLIFAVFCLSLIQHYIKCLQFFMYHLLMATPRLSRPTCCNLMSPTAKYCDFRCRMGRSSTFRLCSLNWEKSTPSKKRSQQTCSSKHVGANLHLTACTVPEPRYSLALLATNNQQSESTNSKPRYVSAIYFSVERFKPIWYWRDMVLFVCLSVRPSVTL